MPKTPGDRLSEVIAKTWLRATGARGPYAWMEGTPPGFERTLSPMPQQTVTLTLGEPIYAQALYYMAMFSQKPFREALLVYRRGGTYTILSPGEDHHGCWVSATVPLDPPRHVSFMSWPSADWDHDIAAHTLTFAPDTGAFTQQLRLPGEPVPRAQHGYAVAVPSPDEIDPSLGWEVLRGRYAATFAALHDLVGVRGRAAEGRSGAAWFAHRA